MWRNAKLGDVATVIAGQSPAGENYNKDGIGTPFMQGKKDYGDKFPNPPTVWTTSVTKLAEKGDILMSVRAPVGALNIANQQVCIGRGLAAIRASEHIEHDYLFYALLQISAKLEGSSGTIFNSINKKQIEEIEFILPSINEQRRIVTKLDAAFAEIDEAIHYSERNIANAKRLYSHGIDKVFSPLKNAAQQLGTNSEINYGYTAKASFSEGTHKFLRITDIQDNTVNWDKVPHCNVEEKKVSKMLLNDGDIVFARTGATTGKSFLVENPSNAVFASYLIRVSVDRRVLLPRYVMHFFQSATYWLQVNQGISGAAQGGFNASKLADLKIPIIPIENQLELTVKLDTLYHQATELASIYEKKLEQQIDLKSAILTQELDTENK